MIYPYLGLIIQNSWLPLGKENSFGYENAILSVTKLSPSVVFESADSAVLNDTDAEIWIDRFLLWNWEFAESAWKAVAHVNDGGSIQTKPITNLKLLGFPDFSVVRPIDIDGEPVAQALKYNFQRMLENFPGNPAPLFARLRVQNTAADLMRLPAAPGVTIPDQFESLGRLPQLPFRLQLCHCHVIDLDDTGIEVNETGELTSHESKHVTIAIAPTIEVAKDDGSGNWKFEPASTPDENNTKRRTIWKYEEVTGTANYEVHGHAQRLSLPQEGSSAAPGQLINPNTMWIAPPPKDNEKRGAEDQPWVAHLPFKLGAGLDLTNHLLQRWQELETELASVSDSDIDAGDVKAARLLRGQVIRSLLRDRAGTGICADPDGGSAAEVLVREAAEAELDDRRARPAWGRVLACLAAYERDIALAEVSIKPGRWETRTLVGILHEAGLISALPREDDLDTHDEYEKNVIGRLAGDETGKTSLSSAALHERLARFINSREGTARAMANAWADAQQQSYAVSSNLPLPLWAKYTWPAEKTLADPVLTGLLDLTGDFTLFNRFQITLPETGGASGSVRLNLMQSEKPFLSRVPDRDDEPLWIEVTRDGTVQPNKVTLSAGIGSAVTLFGYEHVTIAAVNPVTVALQVIVGSRLTGEMNLQVKASVTHRPGADDIQLDFDPSAVELPLQKVASSEAWFAATSTFSHGATLKVLEAWRLGSDDVYETSLIKRVSDEETPVFEPDFRALAELEPRRYTAPSQVSPIWRDLIAEFAGEDPIESARAALVPDAMQAGLVQQKSEARIEVISGDLVLPGPRIPAVVAGDEKKEWFDVARRQTERDAVSALPPARDEKDVNDEEPANEAQPIVFRVDQLKPIDNDEDIWSEQSGVGVLAARPKVATGGNFLWTSLNSAGLQGQGADPENPWDGIVDPLPIAQNPSAGVRSSQIVYDGQALSAPMTYMPTIVGESSGAMPKIYNEFAVAGWSVTHMRYGEDVCFLAYVIGPGGCLPVGLREAHPALLRKSDDEDHRQYSPGFVGQIDLDNLDDIVNCREVLRRVPVSAPRVDADGAFRLPNLPDDVDPLARELRNLQPPVSLANNEVLECFRARGTKVGRIDRVGKEANIALEMLGIELKEGQSFKLNFCGSLPGRPGNLDDQDFLVIKAGNQFNLSDDNGSIVLEIPEPTNLLIRRHVNAEHATIYATRTKLAHLKLDGDPWRRPDLVTDTIDLPDPRTSHIELEDAWLRLTFLDANGDRLTGLSPPSLYARQNPEEGGSTESTDLDTDTDASSYRTVVLDVEQGQRNLGRIRPPAVEFGAFSRWIADGLNDSDGMAFKYVRERLSNAHKLINLPEGVGDRTLDDPAVERLFAELVPLFPEPDTVQTKATLLNLVAPGEQRSLGLAFDPELSSDLHLEEKDGNLVLNVPEGMVAELRIYGVVDLKYYAGEKKFADFLLTGQRREELSGITYVFGAPLRVRIENPIASLTRAASILPNQKLSPSDLVAVFNVSLPADDGYNAKIRRRLAAECRFRDVSNADHGDIYSVLRYARAFRILPQKWSWRGRPLAAIGNLAFVSAEQADIDRRIASDWEQNAFAGRSDIDIGPSLTGKLSREHLRASPDRLLPALLGRYDLQYEGSANYWRFALEVDSRYRAMAGDRAGQTVRTEAPNRSIVWKPLYVPPQLSYSASPVSERRAEKLLARPPVDVILPLTEPLEGADPFACEDPAAIENYPLPPILVELGERWYENGNIGDRLEVVVEQAQHPLPDNLLQQVPQEGSDALLQKDSSKLMPFPDGEEDISIRPLRVEGIIGYTQAPVAETTDYRRSAVIVSLEAPADQRDADDRQYWPMAKIMLRRFEDGKPARIEDSELTSEGELDFEGLGSGHVVFIKLPVRSKPEKPEVRIVRLEKDGAPLATYALIETESKVRLLSAHYTADGRPQFAGQLVLRRLSNETTWLRLIFSVAALEEESSKPRALHVTSAVAGTSMLERALETGSDGWRGGPILTLESPGTHIGSLKYEVAETPNLMPFTDPLADSGSTQQSASALTRPIRVSALTSAIWCQFTPDSSRFRLKLHPDQDDEYVAVVEQLTVSKRKDGWRLELSGSTPTQLSLLRPMADAEREFANRGREFKVGIFGLYAAATEWIEDVSGIPAERYLGLYSVSAGGSEKGSTAGELRDVGDALNERSGRIRLLTVMRDPRILREATSPDDLWLSLFPQQGNDAGMRIVGVSRPIAFESRQT